MCLSIRSDEYNSYQSVYLFSVLRMKAANGTKVISAWPKDLNNIASGSLSGTNVTWQHQICRAEVPYQVGTITTSDIASDTIPVTPCTRHNSATFCPEGLRYRNSNFTTDTWTDLDAIRRLEATVSDKNTVYMALQPFGIPKLALGVGYYHDDDDEAP